MVDAVRHQTSAPPPKLKKLRKNELAANAMVRPNTIWISRRKPPLVSPKASVRPVTMMMITATILATGPWTDSSTCSSGCSQGMPEPAACAVPHSSSVTAAEPASDRRKHFVEAWGAGGNVDGHMVVARSEEHKSELQSL